MFVLSLFFTGAEYETLPVDPGGRRNFVPACDDVLRMAAFILNNVLYPEEEDVEELKRSWGSPRILNDKVVVMPTNFVINESDFLKYELS
mmetsp:Transcript_2364/g.3613  ORF Transcript_2364/g.3613 Transcript_2364/m.3613 type:complete len:90 (-) Transcript_2364:12-281(-)